MRSGTKSLVEGLKFMVALRNQLLNVSDAESQKFDVYGVMCPRFKVTEGEDPQKLAVDVARFRGIQAAPIIQAVAVMRELLREHGEAELVPAADIVPGP